MSKEIVYFAITLAYEAGRILRREFNSYSHTITKKEDDSIVTEVDLKVEEFLKSKIKEKYPDHSIYGEETEKNIGKNTWYIDPIDGTTNFSKKIPFFTTSIGFEGEKISFGVVYAPITDELFYSDGSYSYLNGSKLSVEKETTLENSYLSMCHGRDEKNRKIAGSILKHFKMASKEIRKFGSASLEICYVAASRFDAFFGPGINLWDFKGAYYIAREAGFYIKDEKIKEERFLVCSNPSISEELKETLNKILE